MHKKSYKALGSCYQAVKYGTLVGSMLLSSALVKAEVQDPALNAASSVSEAAIQALSHDPESRAQGQFPAQGGGAIGVHSSTQSLSAEQSVVQSKPVDHPAVSAAHPSSAPSATGADSASPDTALADAKATNQAQSAIPAENLGKESLSAANTSPASAKANVAANAQNPDTTEQDNTETAQTAKTTAADTSSAANPVGTGTSTGTADDAGLLDTTGDSASSSEGGAVGAAASGEAQAGAAGRPLESAGQNKFGNYRSMQSQNKGPLSEGLNTPAGIFQWIVSTIGVLCLIFFLAYMFRKSRFVQRAVGTMQIEGQIALGQKERLMKVRVGERSLLIGVTSNNVNLILDLSAPVEKKPDSKALDGEDAATAGDGVADSTGTNTGTKSPHSTKYSAAYKSAQEAYNRKQYEEILSNLSQLAASAAASAAVSAVHQEFAARQWYLQSAEAAGGASVGTGGAGTVGAAGAGAYGAGSAASMSPSPAEDFADEDYESELSEDIPESSPVVSQTSAASTVTGVMPNTEPLKAKAIIEPHANEAHNIANHFSSEHTIVRASKSTQFMSSQFGLPPDSEVLHARAKRSKHHNRELEASGTEQRPRSPKFLERQNKRNRNKGNAGQADDSGLELKGVNGVNGGEQGSADGVDSSSRVSDSRVSNSRVSDSRVSDSNTETTNGSSAQFGSFLDHAMQDLSKQTGPSTMVETTPWVAEDDLAQELAEHEKQDHKHN